MSAIMLATTSSVAVSQQPADDSADGYWPPKAASQKATDWIDSSSLWQIRVDALLLDRDTSARVDFANQAVGGAVVLGSSDLSFSGEAGTRFSVLRSAECDVWEFAWVENDWASAASVFDTGNLNAIAGSVDYVTADTIATRYASDLDSFELNRHFVASTAIQWLAGFRYAALDESFLMSTARGAQASSYSIATANDLFGFQIGGQWNYCWSEDVNFRIVGKSGIYYAARSQRTDFRDNNNTPTLFHRNENDGVASISEIDAGVSWQVLPRVAVRGGFQYYWFQGVALAPEQFQSSVAAITARPQPNSGDFDAYGGYIGAEFNW